MTYQRTFIIVFKQCAVTRWWMHFIDKRFSHCFLITGTAGGGSIIIDPSEGGMAIYECLESADVVAGKAKQKGCYAAAYTVRVNDMSRPHVKFLRTCVGICKDFLGIDKWWIVTPKQLYEEVKQNERRI